MLSNDPYTVPKVSRRGTQITRGVSSCDVGGGGPKDFFLGGGSSGNPEWRALLRCC